MSNDDALVEVIPRKKVSKAKQKEHEILLDQIRQHVDVPDDYHPVVAMAVIAQNKRLPLNLQLKAHSEVAQFLVRKLKPLDAPNDQETVIPEVRLTLRTKPSKEPVA